MSCITEFLHGESNVSPVLASAVQSVAVTDRNLYFPAGEYHFYPEGCSGKYCYFSNNDEGIKTIAFLLDGKEDFTLRGNNARLIFHGRISPLCAFHCKNLAIEGLTIDFEDSFVSDADLIYREKGIAWFRFSGKHSFKNGRLVFTGDFYDNLNGILHFYGYDTERRELIYNMRSVTMQNDGLLYKDGLIGLEDCFTDFSTNAFVVKHELRFCPAMVFDDCESIRIKNVTIHHAAGMGILVQKSENCFMENVSVIPCNRRVSVSDDALHITDCRGKIKIENCKLSGTLDDSINVHGVFRKLKSRIPGGKMYYLEAGHYQQQGVFNVRKGDTLELFDRKNGKPAARLPVKNVTPINKAFIKIDIDESLLPENFTQGDPTLILESMADLEVRNSNCSTLSGRGVLASGLNSVKICNNHFHTSGAGVFISGDYSFWYESGPVRECVIENNVFDNCNYQQKTATQEPLAVFPELPKLEENYFYHGKIHVKNNHFISAERSLVSIMSAEEAIVTDNSFTEDDTYIFRRNPNAGYCFTNENSPVTAFLHCKKVVDTNNFTKSKETKKE